VTASAKRNRTPRYGTLWGNGIKGRLTSKSGRAKSGRGQIIKGRPLKIGDKMGRGVTPAVSTFLSSVRPIRRGKLSDQVVQRIEQMIVDGSFPTGTLLPPERELMRLFGVGRPSVREALFALGRMGMVALTSGERARVTSPSPDTLITELSGAARTFLSRENGPAQFQEARALFEIGIARCAAQRRSRDDISRLERALVVNTAASGDLEQFERTDVAFHYVLVTIANNAIFTAVHDAMVDWLTNQRRLALRSEGCVEIALRGHRDIFEAVAAGDVLNAERAMSDHLEAVSRLIKAEKQSLKMKPASDKRRKGA
jgi:GntR family transcriptional regulator, sialic acid-inducible nan operon repressor